MVPTAFATACTTRQITLSPGKVIVRVEHPALPGNPYLILPEPGRPESVLQDRIDACIVALHADFITLSQDQWDIL